MGEWKACKLGEVGVVVTGKTPSKNNPQDWGDTIPFITPSDYKNYRKKAMNSERSLSNEGAERLRNKILPSNSVLVTCIGSDMGKIVMNGIEVITNQQINAIIPDTDIVDKDFLYYTLVDMYEILRIYGGDGTAVPIVNKGDFENITFSKPELLEQKAIAGVLSSLDDKIDLLHRQNQTLESLAEILFRQWFVEPVRRGGEAKEEWEEKPLKEICDIQNGYAFKSPTYQEFGQKIIRTLNFSNHWIDLNSLVYISDELAKSFTKYFLKRKDFLLVMVGASLGNFAIVTNDILPALQNQNMWCFRAHNESYQHYLNFMLRKLISDNLHGASGSARLFFQKSVFYELKVAVPPSRIIQIFDKSSEDIFRKIEVNRVNIDILEKTRDTLLPKLMSGEISVF